MSVILDRHTLASLCQLGDGTLTGTGYYPGLFVRPANIGYNAVNAEGYLDYPSTTPDQICKVIRAQGSPPTLGGRDGTVLTGPSGYQITVNVSAGFPATPITGSPFTADTRVPAPFGPYAGANIYPRWTGETAWDLQTYPATEAFTPQGLTSSLRFDYTYPGIGEPAKEGVSFDTGVLSNDPADGGTSQFEQEAEFMVLANADEVCCWNEGAEIELNVDVWQIDFTPTAVAGSPGVFDYTLGSASFHSTLTHTVTIDSSWTDPYNRVHTFTIPKVTGYFTFVNEFYITAVTAP
jgi:hypothetical protein